MLNKTIFIKTKLIIERISFIKYKKINTYLIKCFMYKIFIFIKILQSDKKKKLNIKNIFLMKILLLIVTLDKKFKGK